MWQWARNYRINPWWDQKKYQYIQTVRLFSMKFDFVVDFCVLKCFLMKLYLFMVECLIMRDYCVIVLCLMTYCYLLFWQVKKVQELVHNVSKDNISLALEYYDKDVEKTIQAFLEGEWMIDINRDVNCSDWIQKESIEADKPQTWFVLFYAGEIPMYKMWSRQVTILFGYPREEWFSISRLSIYPVLYKVHGSVWNTWKTSKQRVYHCNKKSTVFIVQWLLESELNLIFFYDDTQLIEVLFQHPGYD